MRHIARPASNPESARRPNEGAVMASDKKAEYVLTKDFAGEHERLQLLEAHVDPLSKAAIEAAGIGPGSRCLEIGAGAGSIARWLAQQAGNASLVCAIDLDTRLLMPLRDEGITVLQHDMLVDD